MLKISILLLILFFILSLLFAKLKKINYFKNFSKSSLWILFLIIIVSFLVSLRVLNNKSSEGTYVPAKYNGKVLQPGKVEFEKK